MSQILTVKNQMQTKDKMGRRIVVATHPRSGTHLTIDLLRKQFQECQSWLWFGETLHHSYLNLDPLAQNCSPNISQKQALSILCRAKRPIIKTHSLPGFNELGYKNSEFISELMQNADVYYVVRDGRNVMCSVHLWMQKFDSKTRCSLSEFLRQEENGMSRPKIWAHHVSSWLKQAEMKLLRFEQIIKDTPKILSHIAQNLGLTPLYVEALLPKRRLLGNRWEDYWLRLTRQFESTTIVGRYQGQKPPKWQEAFTDKDRQFFDREAGDVLIRLGYEVDNSWVKTAKIENSLP